MHSCISIYIKVDFFSQVMSWASSVTGSSVEVSGAGDESAEERAMVLQALGNEVYHWTVPLQNARDAEQAGPQHGGSLSLCQIPPHHHVDGTGLVLQGQEGNARG